jgi:hypothetical protein
MSAAEPLPKGRPGYGLDNATLKVDDGEALHGESVLAWGARGALSDRGHRLS